MSCLTDAQIQDAVVSGEPAPEHIKECERCLESFEAELRLQDALDRLPLSIEPSRDLWPTIDHAIAGKKAVFGFAPRRWLQVAAAAAVLVAGVWIGRQMTVNSATATAVAEGGYEELANEVDSLRRQLATLMQERSEQFDPETLAAVESTLETLDSASSEFSQAMEQAPQNRQLRSMWASSTKREVHVLADLVTTLHGASMTGIDPSI